MLIESGKSPVIDKKFADNFPQYKEYKGETLLHHHIGQDWQAVDLPQNIHKGYGEIHTVEYNLGITGRARTFSKSCVEACINNPSLYGQTSDRFLAVHSESIKAGKNNRCISVDRKSTDKNSIKGAIHSKPGIKSRL